MQRIRKSAAFGAAIRKLRNKAGLTQEQAAAKLQLHGFDISRSVYSQIECGLHGIRPEELVVLKNVFGVSDEDFFKDLEQE